MKLLFIILGTIVLVLAAIFLYTWYRLYKSLHLHVLPDENTIQKYKSLPRKEQRFTTSDGVKISSWYIKAKNPKAFVIVVHGYETDTGGKAEMLGYAKFLREAGYSSLLIDLRSNGESEGNQIYLGVKEWRDVSAAYDYLNQLPETKRKKIGLLGVSMGAATSIIAMGETHKADFLIASVPYARFADLFTFRTQKEGLNPQIFTPPLRLAAFLTLGINYPHFDPIKEIKKIHKPILLFQASKDKSVPPIDAKNLYEAANKPKQFWKSNTGHDIFAENQKEFEKQVLEFLNKYAN